MSYSRFTPPLRDLVHSMICIQMQTNDGCISTKDVQNIVDCVAVLEPEQKGEATVGTCAEAKPVLKLPEDMPEEVKAIIRKITAEHGDDVEIHVHEIKHEESVSKPDPVAMLAKMREMLAEGKPKAAIMTYLAANVTDRETVTGLLDALKNDILSRAENDHLPHFELDRVCNGIFGEVKVYKDLKAPREYQIVHKGHSRDIEMKEGHDFDLTYLRCVELCLSSTGTPHCIIE